MIHVQLRASNPGKPLTAMDLASVWKDIESKYRDRLNPYYWRIQSVEARVGMIILVVPNNTDKNVLLGCVQECLPFHGIMMA